MDGGVGESRRSRDSRESLTPHSALAPLRQTWLLTARFSQQLLDLTHWWWSEAEDPDLDVNDTYPLPAAAHIWIKLDSGRYPDPGPQHPARSLTDLSHHCRCTSWQATASQRASALGSDSP